MPETLQKSDQFKIGNIGNLMYGIPDSMHAMTPKLSFYDFGKLLFSHSNFDVRGSKVAIQWKRQSTWFE